MTSPSDLMDMTGRVVVITGACGHLGRTMSRAMAELGSELVLIDRDKEAVERWVDEISSKFHAAAHGITVDLESEGERAAMLDRISSDFRFVDVLINNAAFVGTDNLEGWAVPFDQQSLLAWRRAFEVNLTACFHLCQSLAALLSKQKNAGSIINIGSIYGSNGPDMRLYEGTAMGNPAAYGASKGGLIQLTRWLSTVLAPKVRENSISPGGIERGQPDEFKARYVERTPLQRMATEDDFIGAVSFFASDMSRYVTGQNLTVDGGWSTW